MELWDTLTGYASYAQIPLWGWNYKIRIENEAGLRFPLILFHLLYCINRFKCLKEWGPGITIKHCRLNIWNLLLHPKNVCSLGHNTKHCSNVLKFFKNIAKQVLLVKQLSGNVLRGLQRGQTVKHCSLRKSQMFGQNVWSFGHSLK